MISIAKMLCCFLVFFSLCGCVTQAYKKCIEEAKEERQSCKQSAQSRVESCHRDREISLGWNLLYTLTGTNECKKPYRRCDNDYEKEREECERRATEPQEVAPEPKQPEKRQKPAVEPTHKTPVPPTPVPTPAPQETIQPVEKPVL